MAAKQLLSSVNEIDKPRQDTIEKGDSKAERFDVWAISLCDLVSMCRGRSPLFSSLAFFILFSNKACAKISRWPSVTRLRLWPRPQWLGHIVRHPVTLLAHGHKSTWRGRAKRGEKPCGFSFSWVPERGDWTGLARPG